MKTNKYLFGLIVGLIGYLVIKSFYYAIKIQNIFSWVVAIIGLGVLVYIITFFIKNIKNLTNK